MIYNYEGSFLIPAFPRAEKKSALCLYTVTGGVSCPVSAALHSCVVAQTGTVVIRPEMFKSDVKPQQPNINIQLIRSNKYKKVVIVLARCLVHNYTHNFDY